MIELRITGETAGHLLRELNTLAGVTSIGQLVQQQRVAQAVQGQPQSDPPLTVAEQQFVETAAAAQEAKPRGRGRPPKVESGTAPQVTSPLPDASVLELATAGDDPGDVPEQFKRAAKNDTPVPKSVEELRALIQKVCSAKSPQITEAIIKKFGEKTSLIPVEKYGEVAAELHAAMA